MKSLCIFIGALCSISCHAQSFEGTITFTYETQHGTAEERLAAEEKIKRPIREKLLKFRAKEQDPTLTEKERALLPTYIKRFEAFLNTSIYVYIHEVSIKNGMTKDISNSDSTAASVSFDYGAKAYVVWYDEKTFIDDRSSFGPSWGKQPVIKKTPETLSLLSHNCVKYQISGYTSSGGEMEIEVWATPEIQDVNWRIALGYKEEAPSVYNEIKGLPLKIVSRSGNNVTINEVTLIQRKSISDSEFVIPPDFVFKSPNKISLSPKP